MNDGAADRNNYDTRVIGCERTLVSSSSYHRRAAFPLNSIIQRFLISRFPFFPFSDRDFSTVIEARHAIEEKEERFMNSSSETIGSAAQKKIE